MSQSSYANALVIVLLTYPASSVVAEGLTPNDIIRSSHAMGPLSAPAAYASVPIERSLRSNATTDETNFFEDRAGFAALTASMENFPSKVSSKVKMSWLRHQSPSNGFKSLKFLEKTPDKLFENPKFLVWIKIVKLKYKNELTKAFTEIYLVVSGHCEDEAALAAFLAAESRTESAMNKDAGSLLIAQVNKWMSAGEDAASTYKLLKLDQTQVVNLFAHPAFLQWNRFMDLKYKEGVTVKMFETLTSGNKNEDATVTAALVEAKKIPNTRSIADHLLRYQVEHWIAAGKDAASIYKLLKLDQTQVVNLFAHPAFLQWNRFMDIKYKNEATVKMFEILMSGNKNEDATVTEALAEGKKIPGASYITDQLLRYQVKHWIADDKNTAASVYKLLKLDQTQVDNPFDNPVFVQWALYVDLTSPSALVAQSEEKAYEVVYKKLLIQCKDDDAVAKALITGLKRNDGTEIIASIMAKYWLVDGQLTGGGDRKVAWIDQTASNDVESQFKYIREYYDNLFGEERWTPLNQLRDTFGEAKVACMLKTATAESAFGKPVQELRKTQFFYWRFLYSNIEQMLLRGIPDKDLFYKIMDDYDQTLAAMVFTEPRR